MSEVLDRANHVIAVFCRAALHRLNGAAPPILYHYTKGESLKGILGSGCFWVNDLKHLNDASELRYAASVLRAHIDRMRAVEDIDAVRPLFDALQIAMGRMNFDGVYILSLVPNGDDLYLWNLYADRGKGVSIALAANDHMMEWEPGWFLFKCQYGDDAVNEFCRHAIGTIRAIYAVDVSAGNPAPVQDYADLFLDNIRWFAPAFKVGSWSDENEWRLFRIGHSDLGERFQRPAPDNRYYVKAPCNKKLKLAAASYGPNCLPETVLNIRHAAAANGYGRIELFYSSFIRPADRAAIDAAVEQDARTGRK